MTIVEKVSTAVKTAVDAGAVAGAGESGDGRLR